MSGLWFRRAISLPGAVAVIIQLLIGTSGAASVESNCDNALTPIIFIHGFLASGDTYASQIVRFSAQGYCGEYLRVFDWNTLGGGAKAAVNRLDTLIDHVLLHTGASKVNLVGHSAGGGLSYNYLSDSLRAQKVARYVHIGSGTQASPAGPDGGIPTLNLYSDGDLVVKGKDIPGATNIRLSNLDHYEVATSMESFRAIFDFFNPGRPLLEEAVKSAKKVPISGKVLTLGENAAQIGAIVSVYTLNPENGYRRKETPTAVFKTDSLGRWGPWNARKGVYYEFYVETSKKGDRPVHYYREPFQGQHPLVYLRTFPGAGSPAGLLLSALPVKEAQSVHAVFSASRAVVHGRDSLTANGQELSSDALCPASRTVIAMFLYDNGDGKTSLTPHSGFQVMRSFLTGVDLFAQPGPSSYLSLRFNGRTMHVPNWNAAKEGVSVAVFE